MTDGAETWMLNPETGLYEKAKPTSAEQRKKEAEKRNDHTGRELRQRAERVEGRCDGCGEKAKEREMKVVPGGAKYCPRCQKKRGMT